MGLWWTAAVVGVLVLASWAAFWSALAANVGMSRGARAGLGALWGLLLGPVGLAVVMTKTRGGGRGVEGRVSAGRQLAGRYSTKARASVGAWRDAGPPGPPLR